MPPLSPESFESPPVAAERPVVPCHPTMIAEGRRAIAVSALGAVETLANLQRRALELDLDVFAQRVAGVRDVLGEARADLLRCPR